MAAGGGEIMPDISTWGGIPKDTWYYGFWATAITILAVVELVRTGYTMAIYYGLKRLNNNFVRWAVAQEKDERWRL